MKASIFLSFLGDILKIVIIALAIVIPIRYFLFQPFMVIGSSMEPNFHHGNYLIIDEISYKLREPQRGEVVVFHYPLNPSDRYIKRIIGLPQETIKIEDGQIFITKDDQTQMLNEDNYLPISWKESWQNYSDFTPISLGEEEYFVLGDNRNASSDSRRWGTLPQKDIIGRVYFQISFPDVFTTVAAPNY